MPADLFLFACAWALWCLLHSLLINGPMARGLKSLCGRAARLVYNLLALVSLSPLLLWEYSSGELQLFVWPTFLWPLRVLLSVMAIWLVIAAARAFDLRDFSGLNALAQPPERETHNTDLLITSGILSQVRHPWYSAGLVLLWMRDQSCYGLVSSVILSLYLLVGAWLEERRLLRRFGQAYVEYRRAVPMFVPVFFRRKS